MRFLTAHSLGWTPHWYSLTNSYERSLLAVLRLHLRMMMMMMMTMMMQTQQVLVAVAVVATAGRRWGGVPRRRIHRR